MTVVAVAVVDTLLAVAPGHILAQAGGGADPECSGRPSHRG